MEGFFQTLLRSGNERDDGKMQLLLLGKRNCIYHFAIYEAYGTLFHFNFKKLTDF